ncbi:MAG: cysteine--tRNA ligase [Desulfovibrionaceae bacterium]|jgi:cysteinyl-tRNA synthetase|nr:cysteine--tRNA ligase [Desulfovibrionaceae bacterium]
MQLYNTLTHKKEPFAPADGKRVNMYVCGITAYDYCHIGHARSAVAFDVLVRQLRSKGLEVNFIRNFTDVDDKIIKRAGEEGISSFEVADKYIDAFYEDMDRLNILRPDVEPRCTGHIKEMIDLCVELIDKGHAYATPSGDVYFRVRSFPAYGKLSGRDIEELRSGARVAPGEEKEDPLDFALWKAAKPGEPSWESPWGQGRPGWHIECSAMSEKYAPLPLDIHGGGQDLVFPHHENEIAQTEAASGKEFARFWVHNGFVQVDSEKMSKSLGNFKTIRDILENYLPETLRFFLLTKQYRTPIDFTFEAMEDAEKNLKRFYETKARLAEELQRSKWARSQFPAEIMNEFNELDANFDAAMDDDLNTAAALGHLFNVLHLVGRVLEDKPLRKAEGARDLFAAVIEGFERWSGVLGVLGSEPGAFLSDLRASRVHRKGIDPARVDELVAKRQEARAAKDFATSDSIRDELLKLGVEVKDTPQGPVWDV